MWFDNDKKDDKIFSINYYYKKDQFICNEYRNVFYKLQNIS